MKVIIAFDTAKMPADFSMDTLLSQLNGVMAVQYPENENSWSFYRPVNGRIQDTNQVIDTILHKLREV